ncbi:sugar phosphate nucleotidyltransferase [Intrasporangium calvum]|uniref:Nucleotidyl transferase n=1 Tax=Intrasporangium calvum (strain ATCC 23552 / DSM 43043 / JCM 3097 / NBRC 12989 / NCIMB 10167 / NRRL B-3866 / 7 KIP) TaxID=710696 RepID=E6SFN6_INTC7|nr:sugar phosphate nucleotidyltransferase [Intrasporangium calvum]ADU47781.1 Nucleotidyl transferase [Intrasporangium calvum DSM 43043]
MSGTAISGDLERSTAPTTATLRDALLVIDRSGTRVCLLVDVRGRLAGLLTDGDLRRAILRGRSLEELAIEHATTSPHTVTAGSPRALVVDLLTALHVSAVPEVAEDGTLLGLHTLSDVVGAPARPNVAVIMAGGRGSRLGDLTRHTPKPLMSVAGRSIIEWIVLGLVGDGIRDIHVSVNYLADQIEDHLGDGSRLGCSVRYLREDPERPLGTAGSLTLLRAERPDLADPVLVMNGDLMVQFDAGDLLRTHRRTGATLTMATRSYQHEVPFGVVETESGRVTGVSEKPTLSLDINAAVYAVEPRALAWVPAGRPSGMPDLVETCLQKGEIVTAWPIGSDWIDVGTPTDLARAKGHA